jgi:hypothetical protein
MRTSLIGGGGDVVVVENVVLALAAFEGWRKGI